MRRPLEPAACRGGLQAAGLQVWKHFVQILMNIRPGRVPLVKEEKVTRF